MIKRKVWYNKKKKKKDKYKIIIQVIQHKAEGNIIQGITIRKRNENNKLKECIYERSLNEKNKKNKKRK